MPMTSTPIRLNDDATGPRYERVTRAVWDAINAGVYRPGDPLPDTRTLSKQLAISPVTTHRGMRELVRRGIVQRVRGKGTFVSQAGPPGPYLAAKRLAVLLRPGTSLSDYYHGAIIEGIQHGAGILRIKLMLLQQGEEGGDACDGRLVIAPRAGELRDLAASQQACGGQMLVIGARSDAPSIPWIDVDNLALATQAVEHLARLGHRRFGFVGGGDDVSNSRDRCAGFDQALAARQAELEVPPWHLRESGWRLGDRNRDELTSRLLRRDRPTAIFAGGYYFALDVYAAARVAGLRIPQDLSVIGVDDPPSAVYLMPPLTTFRQPLQQLGMMAIHALAGRLGASGEGVLDRQLPAELITRGSTARPPSAAGAVAATTTAPAQPAAATPPPPVHGNAPRRRAGGTKRPPAARPRTLL